MAYTKPQIVAQNDEQGEFAASCSPSGGGYEWNCVNCHIKQ